MVLFGVLSSNVLIADDLNFGFRNCDPMTIQFHCTSCNQLLQVADEYASHMIRCPACQEVSRAPDIQHDDAPEIVAAVPAQAPMIKEEDHNPYRISSVSVVQDPNKDIQTYTVRAIISTILCQPLGVVALVFSVLCSSNKLWEDYNQARRYSRLAKIWCTWAIVGGLFYFGAIIFFVAAGGAFD